MKTEILVITDRSGSMSTIKDDVIGGYNQFIEDQKTQAGECRVTYTQFDSAGISFAMPQAQVGTIRLGQPSIQTGPKAMSHEAYEVVYQAKPLAEVPKLDELTFVPRGGTALYDAIGRTLEEQGRRIHLEKWADLVVVCIITDGQENSSKEYSQSRIKEMVAHAEKHGWKFVFLAADQDAVTSARSFGSTGAFAATYDKSSAGTTMAYASTSETVKGLRRGQMLNSVIVKATFDNPVSK